MKLESLDKYIEKERSLTSTLESLTKEKEKLTRQLIHFQQQLELQETIEDKEGIKNCIKAIGIISAKLDKVNEELNNTKLEPYAEAVLSECDEKVADLKDKMNSQWEAVINKRIEFSGELKKMGEIRRELFNVVYSTNGASRTLKRNNYPMPGISGQHALVVNLDHINDLIEVRLSNSY